MAKIQLGSSLSPASRELREAVNRHFKHERPIPLTGPAAVRMDWPKPPVRPVFRRIDSK